MKNRKEHTIVGTAPGGKPGANPIAKGIAVTLTLSALCLGALALPIVEALAPTAHAAGREVISYPSLTSLKSQAGQYKGSISQQVWLGDIYSGNLARKGDGLHAYEQPKHMASHFKDELYSAAQRNRIEAYFWYSLAAAQGDFHAHLQHIPGASEPLGKTEQAYSDYAWDRMQHLKKATWRNKIRGPSFWTAEKLFVDVYRKGGKAAHYHMAKFYKGVDTDFVVRSHYDAFVWMMASEALGFMDADAQATTYQADILYSQELLAELAAKRIIAYSRAVAANSTSSFGGAVLPGQGGQQSGQRRFSQTAPGQSNLAPSVGNTTNIGVGTGRTGSVRHSVLQNSSGPQVTWGSDYQTNRIGSQNSGSFRAMPDSNVESHHSSRSAFDIGNGHLAAGNTEQAKAYFEYAISREPYSRAAVDASRQLQALTMSCSLRDDRVKRMLSAGNRDLVHDISWLRLQTALKALGYYTSYVDGEPGQNTRQAVRNFQRGELNVDDTGYLTTDQRVELICLAAQNVRDADSQNQLGIMYAQGVGFNCNTAAARAWFQKAADQGHPSALYNLGLMYSQGFYDRLAPSEYVQYAEGKTIKPRRIIDPDIAKYYFSEAGKRGHEGTDKMVQMAKKMSNGSKLPRGVVGCIDYEAEIVMVQYHDDITALKNSIESIPSGNDSCPALQQDGRKLRYINEDAKSLWDDVMDPHQDAANYDDRQGQGNQGNLYSLRDFKADRGELKSALKTLDEKLANSSCKAET